MAVVSASDMLFGEREELTRRLGEGLAPYKGRDFDDADLADEVKDRAVEILRGWMRLYNHAGGGDWSAEIYVKGDQVPSYYGLLGDGLVKCRDCWVTRVGTVVVLFRLDAVAVFTRHYVQAEAMPTYLRGSLRGGDTLPALNARSRAEAEQAIADDMDQMFGTTPAKPTREELEDACRAAAELLEEGFDL